MISGDNSKSNEHDTGIDDLWAASEREILLSSKSSFDHRHEDSNFYPIAFDAGPGQQENQQVNLFVQARDDVIDNNFLSIATVPSDNLGSTSMYQRVQNGVVGVQRSPSPNFKHGSFVPPLGQPSPGRDSINVFPNCEKSYNNIQPITTIAAYDNSAPMKNKQPLVDHTYANFSSVDDPALFESPSPSMVFYGETLESIIQKGGATRTEDVVKCHYFPKTRRTETFPDKLMNVLSMSDDDCVHQCISWLPHGRSFKIHGPKLFREDICPRYFKATQYKSVTRQFNLWGFKRITSGRDAGAYYHQMFLRGMPNLVKVMSLRKRSAKGVGCFGRILANPDHEPNFYELAKVRPL